MSIGTRIIRVRNHQGVTQRELSLRSGIASSYLSRIENRRLEPRPKTLRRIAEALGVPVGEFFQEGPAARQSYACAITVSGNCIMEMLSSGRGKKPRSEAETYSPRQLQLLRMANYLIQSGNARLLDSLDLLLNALLNVSGVKSRSKGLVQLGPEPANPPTPA